MHVTHVFTHVVTLLGMSTDDEAGASAACENAGEGSRSQDYPVTQRRRSGDRPPPPGVG